MSTHWYAVNDEAREYIYVTHRDRPVDRVQVAGVLERRSITVPTWVTSGAFRLVCDSEDEFGERIDPEYRSLDELAPIEGPPCPDCGIPGCVCP